MQKKIKFKKLILNIIKKKNNNNNNNIGYGKGFPIKFLNMNNNNKRNNDRYYNNIVDFIPEPKPQTKIESCIINFNKDKDKNKNKSVKIYENNLQNNQINNKSNNNTYNNTYNDTYNNTYNSNYNNYFYNSYNINNINFNQARINEDYDSFSYSNIYDTKNNNNKNNIYLKPTNKTFNLNQNQYSKMEKSLSFNCIKKDTNANSNNTNNNNNLDTPRQPKRKTIINKTEKHSRINVLSDSEEFDNEIKPMNSYSSKNIQIYNKPPKSYYLNDNNSTNNINYPNKTFNNDSDKYSTDAGINYYSNNRDFHMSIPGYYYNNNNMNTGMNSNTEKKTNNNRTIYFNRNINNLNDINSQNNRINCNLFNSNQIIYTKKKNSNKNIYSNTINLNNMNIASVPSNNYNNLNNNDKVNNNNIKAIIRPKIKQHNFNYFSKYYNYCIKYPNILEKNYYYSKIYAKEFLLPLKLPLKQISIYTKYYYKIIQKPKVKNNYIDKKIIRIKKGINLPVSQKCFFIRKRSVIYNTPKIKINTNQEKTKQFDNDYLVKKNNKEYKENNNLKNLNKDFKENNKDLIITNSDEEKKENIKIDVDDKNIHQNININNEINNKNRKYSTPTQVSNKNENNQVLSPQFALLSKDNQPKSAQNKIISIEINLNNKDKQEDKNNNNNNIINSNFSPNPMYNNKINTLNATESLYIKKKPSSSNNEKCKTYKKPHKSPIDEINITDFYNVNTINNNNNYNLNANNNNMNNNINKSNKIICIDIDLYKEQKKLKEQKLLEEQKKIRTYKKPTPALSPLVDPTQNLENKIDNIEIKNNQNNNNNNNINNININLNNDKFKQALIYQLDIISENNLILIVDEIVNLLTKKTVIHNVNNNIIYNKIRLSFMEILSNEYSFAEVIINRVIYDINKITIYANLCNQICIRLTKEFNLRQNDNEEDLKRILMESSKFKFEEIIHDYKYNNQDNKLLGIVLFIGELINYGIISLNIGNFCFETLCFQYKIYLYENNNSINYNYLDVIIEFLDKFGKMVFIEKNLKYTKGIEMYAEQELNYLINNNNDLSILMRNKIIKLINGINNHCMI